jgi:hypothetical protein
LAGKQAKLTRIAARRQPVPGQLIGEGAGLPTLFVHDLLILASGQLRRDGAA